MDIATLHNKRIKGDKNMLYFYCCEVMVRGDWSVKISGVQEIAREIKSTAEFKKAKEWIKQGIFESLSTEEPDLTLDNMQTIFTAFNPL